MESFTAYENAQFLKGTLSPLALPKHISLGALMGGDFSVRYAMPHKEKPHHTQLIRQLGRTVYNNRLYIVKLWKDPTLTEVEHVTETGDGWFQERWYREPHSPESEIGSQILNDYATRLWNGIINLERTKRRDND